MITFKTYSSIDQNLIAQWNKLWETAKTANLFNSHEWFTTFEKEDPSLRYHIYACYKDSDLIALYAMCETRIFGVKVLSPVGYKNVLNTSLLVKDLEETIVKDFFEYITKGNNVYIPKNDIPMVKHLVKLYPHMLHTLASVNPYIPLKEKPFGDISKEHLRYLGNIQKRNTDTLELKILDAKDDLPTYLQTMFDIDTHSGKKVHKKDIFSDENTKELFKNFVKHCGKFVKICVLYFKELPIAYVFCFEFKKTFLPYQASYLSDYRKLYPGKLIYKILLEKLQNSGLELFDFSGGISNYKREFTANYYIQYSLYYSNNILVLGWWKAINLARRINQILFPIKFTDDHRYLFKTYKND